MSNALTSLTPSSFPYAFGAAQTPESRTPRIIESRISMSIQASMGHHWVYAQPSASGAFLYLYARMIIVKFGVMLPACMRRMWSAALLGDHAGTLCFRQLNEFVGCVP